METGGTPAVCPCMIVWEHFKTRAQVAMRLPVCIHCTEQGEKGERHVTAGCAATYPGGYQTTRTGSARQAAGCWQYLRVAAKCSSEQPRAACSLLPTSWGSVPARRSAHCS